MPSLRLGFLHSTMIFGVSLVTGIDDDVGRLGADLRCAELHALSQINFVSLIAITGAST